MSGPAIIDVHVTVSCWPFRDLLHTTEAIAPALKSHGVAQGWAGTFDGVFHKDIRFANARLVDACTAFGNGILLPFGTINPKLPDWEEDLRICVETFGMKGIRLFPNYHGYTLDEPAFAHLLTLATDRQLIVQIPTALEDERMMHPLMRIKPVDVGPLLDVLPHVPGARIVLLNALRTVPHPELKKYTGAGRVYAEIASLEGAGGIGNILQHLPIERLLFGSYFPMFYLESALLKLRESPLTDAQLAGIRTENAVRLLDWP